MQREPGPTGAAGLLMLVTACVAALAGCAGRVSDAMPAFPAFKRSPPGSERIYLLAEIRGRLVQKGRCLGTVPVRGGQFTTIIWPETAVLGRDSRGLYVVDRQSRAVLRLGDRFIGGGGDLPPDAVDDIADKLSEPVPSECRERLGTLNPAFRPEEGG